jgi:hypothetical protein
MPFDAQAFRQAAAQARDEAPPDGRYDAELIDSRIVTANSDGRAWLVLSWKALSGAQRDECWDSLHTIDQYDKQGEPNMGLSITVQTLEAMGIDTQQIRDDVTLSAAVKALHEHGFDVEIKRRPPFTNTYVKGALQHVAASLPGSGGGDAIYGEWPTRQQSAPSTGSLAEQAADATSPVYTGVSDVTPPGVVVSPAGKTQRGDIDPDTGEPFLF